MIVVVGGGLAALGVVGGGFLALTSPSCGKGSNDWCGLGQAIGVVVLIVSSAALLLSEVCRELFASVFIPLTSCGNRTIVNAQIGAS